MIGLVRSTRFAGVWRMDGCSANLLTKEWSNIDSQLDCMNNTRNGSCREEKSSLKTRISKHSFTASEYDEWIKQGKMDDYIMIDFRSKVPNEAKSGERLMTIRKTIIYKYCRYRKNDTCCFGGKLE